MSLRAVKPILEQNRFRALIYGDKGTGKTHFACSFPSAYYIDTEGVLKYKKFVDMLNQNNSHAVDLPELTEIIKEVKCLISEKHEYKTLVIDSLSFPYALLANMEAERLMNSNAKTKEGTEFGANLAKSKRLAFHLGILLTRLDMNVIVVVHEKVKYENNVETGKAFDINDKMGYALGTIMNLRMCGNARKVFVEKSRYSEFETNEFIDFDNGYEVIESRMGKEVFTRESAIEMLATVEQVNEFNRLVNVLKISDDIIQKWKALGKSNLIEEMNTNFIKKCIDKMKSKLEGEDK